MKMRKFGKLGIMSSAFGLGCMRFTSKVVDGETIVDEEKAIDIIRTAIDGGTTYMNDNPHIIFPIMAVLLSNTPVTGPGGGNVYYTFDYDAVAKTLNGVRRTGP